MRAIRPLILLLVVYLYLFDSINSPFCYTHNQDSDEHPKIMVSSLPELPPPLSFICIIGILIVYAMCCYLIIDFISQDEESTNSDQDSQTSYHSSYSHLSVEELQETTCLYHKVGSNCSTCAICLENFRRAEVCRVLPACHHQFHAQCIDPWLSKRFTCPTCRAPFRSTLIVKKVVQY